MADALGYTPNISTAWIEYVYNNSYLPTQLKIARRTSDQPNWQSYFQAHAKETWAEFTADTYSGFTYYITDRITVSGPYQGLHVITDNDIIFDATSTDLLGNINRLHGLTVDDTHIYVYDDGIYKYLKSDLTQVGFTTVPSQYNAPLGMGHDDDYLYITTWTPVESGNYNLKVRKSDLQVESFANSQPNDRDNIAVVVDDDYMYVADIAAYDFRVSNHISIYNKSDLTFVREEQLSREFEGTTYGNFHGQGMAIDGDYIYIAYFDNYLYAYKKTDFGTLLGRTALTGRSQIRGASIHGSLLYIGDRPQQKIVTYTKPQYTDRYYEIKRWDRASLSDDYTFNYNIDTHDQKIPNSNPIDSTSEKVVVV